MAIALTCSNSNANLDFTGKSSLLAASVSLLFLFFNILTGALDAEATERMRRRSPVTQPTLIRFSNKKPLMTQRWRTKSTRPLLNPNYLNTSRSCLLQITQLQPGSGDQGNRHSCFSAHCQLCDYCNSVEFVIQMRRWWWHAVWIRNETANGSRPAFDKPKRENVQIIHQPESSAPTDDGWT